jgi:hypothetical protein
MKRKHDPLYEEHLLFLKDEVRDLELQLADTSRALERKRGELVNYMNSAAPVTAVPTEILMEIIKAGHRSASDGASLFALLVSHISRRWREVALHSPFLWTIIHFGDGLMKSGDLLDLYLERSRTCLLDVSLVFLWHPNEQDDCNHVLPGTLIQQTTRWRSLIVNSACTEITVGLWGRLTTQSAPALRSFEIDYGGECIDGRDLFNGKGGAPLLSSITFCNMGLYTSSPPLASLTSLQVGPDFDASPWLDTELACVLENAPVLQSLVFQHDLCMETELALSVDSIVVPSLQSLEISCPPLSQGTHIGRLYALIEAPNLESLILDFPNHGDIFTSFINSLRETPLSVKFPRLQMLALQLHRVLNSWLIELCDLCPAVTRIASTRESGHALLQLLDTSNGDIHWRKLQNISVSESMQLRHLDLLCTVLTSRITAGCPILRLDVTPSFFHNVPRDRVQWLRERVELAMSE